MLIGRLRLLESLKDISLNQKIAKIVDSRITQIINASPQFSNRNFFVCKR